MKGNVKKTMQMLIGTAQKLRCAKRLEFRIEKQLDRFLQERCARMILDANFQDNSGMLFTKLGWLLTDDIIRTRKLSLLHKICNGCGPEYLSSYVNYVKGGHDYNTRTPRRNYLITPKCKKNSGPRAFHSSATRLWNKTEPSLRDTLSQKRFLRDLQRKKGIVEKKASGAVRIME